MLQCLLRFDGQTSELANHEVHDIIRVALFANAIEIPGPTRRVMIKAEQSLVRERVKKLNHEEGIPGGLLMH